MEILSDSFTRWIEIDLDKIKHNVRQVRAALGRNTQLMAVVKGDAYGCGSVGCATAAVEAGCDMLGVTTLEEAIELRLGGVEHPILVFSPLLKFEVDFYLRYDLIPTVIYKESIEALAQASSAEHALHLKIETGMGRLGLRPQEVEEFITYLKSFNNLKLAGIYTHFAKVADKSYVKKQVDNLLLAKNICEENGFSEFIVHASASAAFLKYPEFNFDMIRIGTLIYGQEPAGISQGLELKDPWKCKARILQIKNISAGESVGYGRDFIAKKDIKIAIIPIGLADGFSLDPPIKAKSFLDLIKIIIKEILKYLGKFNNISGVILHNGRPLPIIGRIGMQMLAVDVTNITDVEKLEEVSVGIRRTSVSARIARVYMEENMVKAVRSIAETENKQAYAYRGGRA